MDTINTDGYMIAGYVVTFASMGLYLLSLYLRKRNLQRDLETYQALNDEK
ncbi:MAG: hypothetical protein LC099_11330 [Anaerolineales bacterium]|nr:hypothetical protein [Anaerolineales bacterium]